MPEPIGKTIRQKFQAVKDYDEGVDKFNVLQFLVTPHDHGITAEVALFNNAGECVGPALWVQLNPDSGGVDRWPQIVKMTLVEINAKVKAVLQELEDGA